LLPSKQWSSRNDARITGVAELAPGAMPMATGESKPVRSRSSSGQAVLAPERRGFRKVLMQSLTALDNVRSGRHCPARRPKLSIIRSIKFPFRSRTHSLTEMTAFGSNPGHLRMWKFIPMGLGRAAPLAVVLHGCGQTAQDINHGAGWSALANESGFALLVPEQRPSNNAKRGFNWYQPGDTGRGSGEALSILQMVQCMIEGHDLDRRRVYIAGLSAGGAMTSALLAAYPDVFAGGAIIAGLPFGAASNLWSGFGEIIAALPFCAASNLWCALNAMKGGQSRSSSDLGGRVRAASHHQGPWPKLSIWHGSADNTVAPSNADAITRQWCNVHGLGEGAAIEAAVAGQTRRFWRDRSGAAVIETFIIPGMAHGAPVDPLGKSGHAYGVSAPFFEDAGISSTYQIAKFWGLAAPEIQLIP
jgi:poly(3-hydroxybutyrate) depolymerase